VVFNDLLGPLNQLARPLIKAGLGGPCLTPFGLIVVEIVGRRSGIVREVPLLALRHRGYLVVGSASASANWLANLDKQQHAILWMNGLRWTAEVKDPGSGPPEALHRRIATATRRLFGERYHFRVLELAQEAGTSSVGDTSRPFASA
jgi:hypothetical protein